MPFLKKSAEAREQVTVPAATAADTTSPAGKGRPTPRRREAQAANRRPLVGPAAGRDSKGRDGKARARSERARVREAMLAGDERHLPARDKGPERRFLRDAVDVRRTVGEFLLPAMLVVLALTFLPSDVARFASMLGAYLLMLFGIFDSWLLWRRTKARFIAAFGHEPGKGSATYVVLRGFQMRGSRIPRPAVKVGDELRRR